MRPVKLLFYVVPDGLGGNMKNNKYFKYFGAVSPLGATCSSSNLTREVRKLTSLQLGDNGIS